MNTNDMTRREMLKLSGLTALILGGALSAGTVARAATTGIFSASEGSPYEAWSSATDNSDARSLVAAAILGANPHNTQPWRFRLSGNTIDVFADRSRALAATDPTGSELIAGLGCAIENIAVAASAAGSSAAVEVSPAGAGGVIARVRINTSGAGEGADLFPAVKKRHTNRGPYRSDISLPGAALEEGTARLGSLPLVKLSWLQDAARDRFGGLVIDATAAVIGDRGQSDEINRWWRATRDDVERYRDGLTLDAQSLPAVTLYLAKMMPPTSQAQNDQSWLKSTKDVHVKTATAFGLLSVENASDFESQIQVGRAYQRLHLWATASGLAMQPLNQVTERIFRDRSLGKESPFEKPLGELTPTGGTTLFTFRIGHPTVDAGLSPRRRLDDVLDA